MNNTKSKKIGTISLNINTPDFNYGAILHSWAFQKYLQKNKLCEYTEIIDYITPKLENTNRKSPIKDALKTKNIKGIIKNILIYPSYKKRYKKFEEFKKNDLVISTKQYTQKELDQATLDYDTVICESDVIWSPGFFGGDFDKAFFMNLKSMENMKKISYAPSMADGELTKKQEEDMTKLLEGIDYISCRESYEKDLLSKLTTKNVEHVLDPVMLLDADDYNEITGDRILKRNYVLLYLPVDNNKRLRKEAIKYAKEKNLDVLEISTKCLMKFGNKTLTHAGVEEFLSAIKFADTVFTNSFHAICFALIFNKNFYAFSRANFGKVKNICDVTNLSERFFEDDNFKALPNINYEDINATLSELQKKSKEWLENALNN